MHPENDCIISTMMMRHILLISTTLSATYYCLFGAESFHINKMETEVFLLALIKVRTKMELTCEVHKRIAHVQ